MAGDREDAVGKLLNREMESIQTHRDFVRSRSSEKEEEIERIWRLVIITAKDLKKKIIQQPRLRYFHIPREEMEVTISFSGVTDAPKDIRELSFYRKHPKGRHQTSQVIWCYETYQDERRFTEAEEIIKTMVRFCAVNMV